MNRRLSLIILLGLCVGLIVSGGSVAESPSRNQGVAKARSTDVAPFQADVAKLPKDFQGVPIKALAKRIEKTLPKKGEFETQAEVDRRLARWLVTPLLGRVTPTDLIAIRVDFNDVLPTALDGIAYDADKALMTVEFMSVPEYGLLVTGETRGSDSYVGQNAYGTKTVVKRYWGSRYSIAGVPNTTVSLGVQPADARRIKTKISGVIIGNIASPYLSEPVSYQTPTLSDPTETAISNHVVHMNVADIFIIDRSTGDILYKRSTELREIELRRQELERLGQEQDRETELRRKQKEIQEGLGHISEVDQNGNTALHSAIWDGKSYLASEIIKTKAVDLDRPNKFGDTALHLAVAKRNLSVATELVGAGASVDVKDNAGQTPLDLAQKNGYLEFKGILTK